MIHSDEKMTDPEFLLAASLTRCSHAFANARTLHSSDYIIVEAAVRYVDACGQAMIEARTLLGTQG